MPLNQRQSGCPAVKARNSLHIFRDCTPRCLLRPKACNAANHAVNAKHGSLEQTPKEIVSGLCQVTSDRTRESRSVDFSDDRQSAVGGTCVAIARLEVVNLLLQALNLHLQATQLADYAAEGQLDVRLRALDTPLRVGEAGPDAGRKRKPAVGGLEPLSARGFGPPS